MTAKAFQGHRNSGFEGGKLPTLSNKFPEKNPVIYNSKQSHQTRGYDIIRFSLSVQFTSICMHKNSSCQDVNNITDKNHNLVNLHSLLVTVESHE